MLAQFPERQELLDHLEREYEAYLERPEGERSAGVKVIPTVIHVIHDNGPENLSKEFLLNAMEIANQELQAQNAGLASVIPEFQNVIGNPEFELRLAKIDPNGNCTDGITRTQSDMTYEGGENVKSLINWNTGSRRYLQIWTVQTVGSGAGGYTFLPGSVGAQNNGIIIRAAQYTSTVSHEFGHWVNLAHPWGPTNEPGVQSNCGFDDNVGDTPNTIGASGCNLSQVSCGSLDNIQNHMDYSFCAHMFTAGQASRMQSAAESWVGGRDYYWSNENRTNTGTVDGFVVQPCVPVVDFSLDNAQGCEGLDVDFEDNLWGADRDASWVWNWSFPGGTPSSSTDENPTVIYNAAGTYDVTLTLTTAAGSDSRTIQDAVTVEGVGNGIYGLYQEGVEASDFPDNANEQLVWKVDPQGGVNWQRTTAASSSGDASVRINLRNNSSGDVNNLITPPINMIDVPTSQARMTFKIAHANRNSNDHDERLRVYASKDCGESWSLRYTEDGDDLNTAGANVSGTFVPNANQWREEEVSLATMAGEEHVLIRFETTSDRQSYLYLDDININGQFVGVREIDGLRSSKIYPNPIDGTSQLEIELAEGDEFTLNLVDMLGKQLATIGRNLTAGSNRIPLADFRTDIEPGIYMIQMNTQEGQKTLRFVKN